MILYFKRKSILSRHEIHSMNFCKTNLFNLLNTIYLIFNTKLVYYFSFILTVVKSDEQIYIFWV